MCPGGLAYAITYQHRRRKMCALSLMELAFRKCLWDFQMADLHTDQICIRFLVCKFGWDILFKQKPTGSRKPKKQRRLNFAEIAQHCRVGASEAHNLHSLKNIDFHPTDSDGEVTDMKFEIQKCQNVFECRSHECVLWTFAQAHWVCHSLSFWLFWTCFHTFLYSRVYILYYSILYYPYHRYWWYWR